MKKILKPGKTINRELTCPVCGCVFTYELVDIQEEFIHNNISLMFLNNITKKYVTCLLQFCEIPIKNVTDVATFLLLLYNY